MTSAGPVPPPDPTSEIVVPGGSNREVLAALRRLPASGGRLVLKGAFRSEGSVPLPSNLVLRGQGVEWTVASDNPPFIGIGSSHVTVDGDWSLDGAGHPVNMFTLGNATDFAFRGTARITGLAGNKALFQTSAGAARIALQGTVTTDGSNVCHLIDTPDFFISGIRGRFSRAGTRGFPTIKAQATGSVPVARGRITDVDVDVQNAYPTTPVIQVGTMEGQRDAMSQVEIDHCTGRNSGADLRSYTQDFIDVNRARGVAVHDVRGDGFNSVVSYIASAGSVARVVGRRLTAPAVLVGDPNPQNMTAPIGDVSVEDVLAVEAGQRFGPQNLACSGVAVLRAGTTKIERVRLARIFVPDPSRVTAYGLAIGPGVSGVSLEGANEINGFTREVMDQSGGGFSQVSAGTTLHGGTPGPWSVWP